MKTFSTISFRYLCVAILACVFTLLLNSTAGAQKITDGSTPLGISPGAPTGSYSLSDFDSVNLYNGSLNFRLPLVKIGGRGGAGFTMVMRIEKKWLVEKEQGQPNRYSPNAAWWDLDNQEPIYSVGKLEMRQAGSRDFILGCSQYIHRETLTRLTFTAPDGTEYELRDQLTNGRPDHPTCNTGFNRGRIFVTADGSSATFISDADIVDYIYDNPANPPASGYLVLRDGTHYRIIGGRVMSMRDRNGNQLTFNYTGVQLTSVTDSLNRQVSISYSAAYDEIIVKGFGGAARSIKIYKGTSMRSDYSARTYQSLFPELNGSSDAIFTPAGVTSVQLPNGQQYQFYYNSYSELARVVLPTGGAIEYDYAPGLTDGTSSGVITSVGDKHVYRRVVERRVYPTGGTGATYASRMTYSRPESSTSNAGYVVADQYNLSGTLLGRSYHYFYGSPRASFGQQPTQYSGWRDGREYQTTIYATDGTPLRQSTNTFAQRAPVTWWTGNSDQEPPNDPRLVETVTTLMDTNQVAKQTSINPYDNNDKGFDQYNNKTDSWEYDYGVGLPGGLVRHTHTTFLSATNYTDAVNGTGLRGLPSQTSVYDAEGFERARTSFEYDNYNPDTNHATLQAYPRPGFDERPISGLDPSFNSTSNNLTRGNVTATTDYLLNGTGGVTGSVTAYAQYDIAGNTVKTIDGRAYSTTLDYSDRFGTPDGDARLNTSPSELSSQGQSSYAFTTLVTNALGQTTYAQLDYYLGQTVNAEGTNGIVSSVSYNDALDRPKQVTRAVNGGANVRSQTTISYDDVTHVVTTTGDRYNYGDSLVKSETVYDGLGRTTEKRQYETSSSYISVKQTYDVLGRSSQTSNPFRLGETILWTTTAYDDLSRVVSVTTPDNAVVKTAYSGNRMLVADQNETDQLRRKRISKTDALGRLKDVWEVRSADGATEAVTFPGWPDVTTGYRTSYDYDTLDNLTIVTQGGQTRGFAYDSLKRLTTATSPESGMISYQYDENGNLKVKTDARGVSAHLSYDALNRPIRRWYNGSSFLTEQTNNLPALPVDVAASDEVDYFYDSQGLPSGAPSLARGYATGRLVAVTYGTGGSSGDYYGYDAAGRVVLKIQQTGGANYQLSASYNLAGATSAQTYPSGHIVNYAYDSAGRTNSVTGRLGDGRNRTYATGISYSSFGGLTQEQFGTQTSLYHKLHYNTRGQLYDIRVSTQSLQTDEFNWNRGCLALYYGYAWGQSGPANNGNISSSQHWVPFNDAVSNYSYTQDNFSYDSLNRLLSTNEIHGGPNSQSGQDYVQSYDYDRWGNRTINSSSSGVNNVQFDKSDAQNSNRLYAPGDLSLAMSQRKMQYDAGGNLTHDSYTGNQRGRSYDAENRLSLLSFPTPPPPPPVCYPDGEGGQTCYPVDPRPGPPPIQYVYDGDGHRVRRFVNDQETRQIYGLSGELLAEYAASTSPNALQKEYGYRNGQLLITAAPGYGSLGSTGPGSSSNTSESSATLLARNSEAELPEWMRGLLSANASVAPVSDSSTPLFGPRFPYASLNSSIPPVMPQSGISKIAFASNREGTAQLYSMNTDGSGTLRLTNDAANDESPQWSANGSRIIFQSDRDNVFSGMADIYVMNGDGSGQTRLTSDANDDSAPVWSLSGSKIAFQSARSGVSYQVYTMNSDGSGQVNISNNVANDKQPSWSPDGTKIAFASDRDQAGFSSIYVMNANGSNQTRLTFSGSGFRDEQPAWSPDGTKLAFTSTRDSSVVTWTETDDDGNTVTKTAVVTNKEVYVMNANGSNQVRLTYALENDDSPTWSSDGTQIAFRSDRERDCCDPTNQVWVMNANGSNPVDLSNNGFGDYSPNWSNIMAPPPPPNGAQFISQSDMPQTMTAGQNYSVSVTVKNIGSNTWTSASNYNLGSQNAQDNTTWGMGRVGLPSSLASGSQVTFNFTVTAPATSGTYNFQWRMVQDGVEWFGDFTPNVVVTVNPQSGGNPNPEPDPSTPIADVRWIVADQLGTPRIIFDQSGSLANASRHDYLPFGEELADVGGRTTAQGYTSTDGARQKFTEKERDAETGLDYFGARYYASTQGRFTSVDPYNIVREAQIIAQNSREEARAHLVNYLSKPQQWNRYAYVANNPLKYVDPTGELLELTGSAEEQKAAFERIKWMVGKEAARNLTMTQMCTSGGHCGTYVTYNETLSGRSGLANSGKLNSYIGQIIDSDKTVEFRIADSFTTKFGETRETGGGFCGGGCTVGSEESTTGNTQIFVNKESSAIAEKTFSEPRMSGRFTGAHLSFEDDIVDAHEFGHAFANAIEGKPLRNSSASYDRAVEFENLQRSTRYPERTARRRVE